MSRDCKYIARVSTSHADFNDLVDEAKRLARATDRYVEVQPGYMAFHFEAQDAFIYFCTFITGRNMSLLTAEEQKLLGRPLRSRNEC